MKLSVSAYQAGSSTAQKILSQAIHSHHVVPQHLHHGPLHGVVANYGATSSTAAQTLVAPRAGPSRLVPDLKVEEVDGRNSPSADGGGAPSGGTAEEGTSGGGAGDRTPAPRAEGRSEEMVDSSWGGRQKPVRPAPEAATPSCATASKGKRPAPPTSLTKAQKGAEGHRRWGGGEEEDKKRGGGKSPGLSVKRNGSGDTEDILSEKELVGRNLVVEEGEAGRKVIVLSRAKSAGEQHWSKVRTVMALYTRLRMIKRSRSNQRWMKLRTTVQLSGAISSTIQKKAPLKREDSFLKRFSTRQIPETQETMDTGDDGDDGGSSSAGGVGGGGEGGGEGGGAGGGGSSTHAATEERRRRRRRMAHHRRRQASPRSVINPDENFYFYWLFVLTACVLYNLWTLIVRQSFPELQSGLPVFWRCGDAFGDAIFLLDVAVQFRTGYLEQGLMVYDSKKLAAHYVTSKAFLLDLFALAPLDLVQLSPRVGPNPILRFPRFLKEEKRFVVRKGSENTAASVLIMRGLYNIMGRLYRPICGFYDPLVYRLIHYYYMVESRTVYPNLWRVVNLVHILLILAHWFGCFYYLLSEAEGFQGDWVYPQRLEGDYATLTRKYLGSLYWSTLTLTTIGDLPTPETNADGKYRKAFSTLVSSGPSTTSSPPPSSPTHLQSSPMDVVDASSSSYVNATYTPVEASASGATGSTTASTTVGVHTRKSRLLQFSSNRGFVFTIVSYLIGVFIFATIVGQVGNVITNRNANRLEFERLLDGAKTYMRHHKVPGGMKRRVLRWYDYSWSRGRIQGGGDINTALGLLPDKLKTELALHVNLSVLKKVTIFQECQPEFLHDLVLKMKAYIFTPGDLICRKGEVAREMFIIADGILEVMSETGRVLTTMKAGDFFGEIGILNLDGLNKRTADVRSVGYSELFSLSREDVLAAMKDYPEAQEILQSLGRKRLMEVRNSGSRGGNKKAGISRSSTKIPNTPSPASTKSSPPAFGKCSYKENEASSSSSSPALLDGGSTEHYSADAETGIIGKKIVERLKNDVMGLRDVLRRSKKLASRGMGDEAIELQPLTKDMTTTKSSATTTSSMQDKSPQLKALLLRTLTSRQSTSNREGSSSIKGALRRMSRVKSDDSGGESKGASERKGAAEEEGKQEEGGKTEVIGEGLPLLTRLRMLREKEERERKKREEEERKNRLEEEGVKAEVIGEGLPLLTRLGMLREKEEREKAKGVERRTEDSKAGKREEESLVSPEAERTTSASQTEEGAATSGCGGGTKFRRSLPPTKATEENRRSSFAEDEKRENETRRRSNASLEFVSIASTASQISVAVVPPRTRDLDEIDRGNGEAKKQGARTEETGEEISVLRREDVCEGIRCVVVQVEEEEEGDEVVVRVSEEADNESCCSAVEEKREHRAAAKPFLSRLRGDRNYASVDDLSPEYSGLPFVKKLKILNDRQRLAELEKSSSLDGGERIPENDARGLARSLSDGSRVSHPPRFRSSALPEVASEGKAYGRNGEEEEAWRGLSPESNETPERRNLKSILKKLSGSLGGEEETKHLRRSLMRAQTVEGYAARHTKLAKSVTFNRDTLASPPRTPAPGDACSLGSEPSECHPSRGSRLSIIPSWEDHRLREDEECAEEVIHGIERVFRSQLDEIHEGFRDRFRSLELEVKKRDEIISCLQKRIEELENKPLACSSSANGSAASLNNDSSTSSSDERNPFTRADSADTVVTADAADDSIVEREEKEDSGVARQRSNRTRKEERRCNEDDSSSLAGGDPKGLSLSTWLGEDSNTRSFSSESSIATSSSSSSQDEHQEEHHRHQITTTTNKDWEVQMLAREFERRQGARRLEEEGDDESDAVTYDRLARRFLRLSRSERELLERLLGSEDETEEESAKKRTRKNETGRKGISRKKNGTNKAGERKWRRRESESRGKAWIGQQVLNARSLEETGSCSGSFVTRSASAGDLPPFQLPIPSLTALSNSMRGMVDKGICRAAPAVGQMREPDPEKAVVTISGECPSDASLSKLK